MTVVTFFVATTCLLDLGSDEGAWAAPRHIQHDPGCISERVSHVGLQERDHSEEKAERTHQKEGGASC